MKIGRNERCPCDSGKKYKNCCLQKDELAKPKTMSYKEFGEYIQKETNEDQLKHPEKYKDPEPIFGYISIDKVKENRFVLDEHGLVCKITNVTYVNIDQVRDFTKKDFRVGHWYLTTEPDGTAVVDGPFNDKDAAIEFARSLTKVELFSEQLKS